MKSILYFVMGILLGLLVAGGMWLAGRASHEKSVALPQPPVRVLIRVNVLGAVAHPGIYDLDGNSRVADAVAAAGGFVVGADKNSLNLAARLGNAQNLKIPFVAGFIPDAEQSAIVIPKETPTSIAESESMNVNSAGSENLNITPDVGTAIPAPGSDTGSCSDNVIGSGAFVWPADSHSLSGNDYGPNHPGIDIAAGEGSPVYAADSGVVRMEGGDDSGYGNVIQIDHGNGYSTLYAHLSVIGVHACQGVDAGQWIGSAGNTGNSDGAHLHFEVTQDGLYISPWIVLP